MDTGGVLRLYLTHSAVRFGSLRQTLVAADILRVPTPVFFLCRECDDTNAPRAARTASAVAGVGAEEACLSTMPINALERTGLRPVAQL